MTLRFASLAALLSLIGSARAVAQEIPIQPAGADGRFQTQFDTKTKVVGMTPAQVTAFRQAFDGLTDRLVAMPEVRTPTAPMCMRVSTFLGIYPENGLITASIDVRRPVLYAGRCTKLTGAGVEVRLNDMSSFLTSRERHGEEISGDGAWYALPLVSETDRGFVVEEDGEEIEVLTHGRTPLLRRISVAQALKAKREAVNGLSPAQLASPACWVDYQIVAQENCPLGQQMVEINPAYFDLGKPAGIQIITLRTGKDREHGEDAAGQLERRAIWRALDREAIRGLVK